jgi:predicted nucleotide-binding protein (sugar kinase/HSP70/actin superfamily)
MFKKTFIILIIAVLIGLSLVLGSIFAQRYYEEEPTVACEELTLIEEELDKVLALLEKKSSKEILEKLDQILENQAQIKNELRIIKVRASR